MKGHRYEGGERGDILLLRYGVVCSKRMHGDLVVTKTYVVGNALRNEITPSQVCLSLRKGSREEIKAHFARVKYLGAAWVYQLSLRWPFVKELGTVGRLLEGWLVAANDGL